MSILIESCKSHPEKISEVLLLHKQNAATLGFLPEQVFRIAMEENRLLIAIDRDNSLIGYLLYNINKRHNYISITHLCVSSTSRNKGVARNLFGFLEKESEGNFYGVKVTCRQDYDATKLWENLGFTFCNEKAGRRRLGSVLFVWYYNFNHTNLFSVLEESVKSKIVLDSNIVYDLMDDINDKNQNSHALFSDWLVEEVDYYITNQLSSDISHSNDLEKRQRSRTFLENFKLLEADGKIFKEIDKEVQAIYDKRLTDREASDVRHLSWTIAAGAKYFLTKDAGIIKYSEKIFDKYALIVTRPEDFIIEIALSREDTDYRPSSLVGTRYQKRILKCEDLRNIAPPFFISNYEKKRQFESKLKAALIKKQSKAYIVENDEGPKLLYTIHEDSNALEIEFLRNTQTIPNSTILNQIIHDVISFAQVRKKHLIIISEAYVNNEIEYILDRHYFIKINNHFYKIVGNISIRFDQIKDYIDKIVPDNSFIQEYISQISIYLSDKKYSFLVERMLFPLKIIDSDLPCFIIPIKPHWAMNLFHRNLSEEDLFGGNSELLFNKENVYYRSSTPLAPVQNSRALWYISKGKSKTSTMNIAASSYINNVEINNPKLLYKKYSRFGIYKWENLLQTAKDIPTKDILAFTFDLTENFHRNINVSTLDFIFKENCNKKFTFPQSPYRISENLYFDIYHCGMKENSNGE